MKTIGAFPTAVRAAEPNVSTRTCAGAAPVDASHTGVLTVPVDDVGPLCDNFGNPCVPNAAGAATFTTPAADTASALTGTVDTPAAGNVTFGSDHFDAAAVWSTGIGAAPCGTGVGGTAGFEDAPAGVAALDAAAKPGIADSDAPTSVSETPATNTERRARDSSMRRPTTKIAP